MIERMSKGGQDEDPKLKIGGGDTCQGDSGGPLIRLGDQFRLIPCTKKIKDEIIKHLSV